MRSFVRRITALQQEPGVLSISALHGFEGADVPEMGSAVVVVTDDDPGLADRLAGELAEEFATLVTGHEWLGPDVADAVDQALALTARPVVLADRSDNAGAGAPSDSTYVLAELLRRGVEDAAVALLWDPVAVDFCHQVGEGARLRLRIGGKACALSGDPLDVDAVVLAVRTDARQAMYGAAEPRQRLGLSAAIRVDGVEIVLNSRRTQVFSPHVFTAHGIDPAQRRLLVVKSMQHFMAGFGELAGAVVRCDGPGAATMRLESYPYRRIVRPLHPIDLDVPVVPVRIR